MEWLRFSLEGEAGMIHVEPFCLAKHDRHLGRVVMLGKRDPYTDEDDGPRYALVCIDYDDGICELSFYHSIPWERFAEHVELHNVIIDG